MHKLLLNLGHFLRICVLYVEDVHHAHIFPCCGQKAILLDLDWIYFLFVITVLTVLVWISIDGHRVLNLKTIFVYILT